MSKPVKPINEIICNLRRLVPEKEKLLIACSGGADSMALLFCAKKSGIPIAACHVVHDMRPESETNKDVDCVKRACEKLGVELRIEKVSAAHLDGNAENNYRYLRRLSLYAVAQSYETETEECISFIATGHHADDQLETIIMKLCRGTGLEGLSGIAETAVYDDKFANPKFIRPMLSIVKRDIYEICKENRIEFVEDSTNKNLDITRNAIREKVLPVLRDLFPKCAEHSTAAAKSVRSAINLVEEKLDALIPFEKIDFSPTLQCRIRIEALQVSEDVVIHAWLRKAVNCLPNPKLDRINSTMYNQVILAIRLRKHKTFQWNDKTLIIVDRDFVTVRYSERVAFIAEKDSIAFVERPATAPVEQAAGG